MKKQITYEEAYFDPYMHRYDYSRMTEYTVTADTDEEYAAHMAAITDPERGIPQDSIVIKEVSDIPEDIESARAYVKAIVGEACRQAIHTGIDVETSQGIEHFSLTQDDQTNIGTLALSAQAGMPVLYHAAGKLCRIFAPEEMMAVAAAAIAHKAYHTTYCNHLNVWIARAERDELEGITYGVDLPPDLAANMNALLAALQS